MAVTASFQGQIDVPVFWTGYTLTGTTGTSINILGGTGSQPLFRMTPGSANSAAYKFLSGANSQPYSGYNQVISGGFSLATIGGVKTLSIGNGTGTPISQYSDSGNFSIPFMYQNCCVFPMVEAAGALVSTNTSAGMLGTYAQIPFTDNITTSAISSKYNGFFISGPVVNGGATVPYTYFATASGQSNGGRINITVTFPNGEFQQEGFYSPLARNAGKPYYAVHYGFSGIYGLYQETDPLNNFSHPMDFIVPAPEIANNYQWFCPLNGTSISVRTFKPNYNVAGGTMAFTVTPYVLWTTDSAAVNARINALQYTFQACASCWLLNTPDGDYLIAKDGLRYWKLNYQPSNILRQLATTLDPKFFNSYNAGTQQKWIDKSGILWIIGQNAYSDNGGTRTFYPAYSLQLNIAPFTGITLPVIPPLAGPCWSPCYDRIGGRPGNISPTGWQLDFN